MKRDLNLLYIRSNLQRLSDETLEKIVKGIEEEVQEVIDKEMENI